MEFSHVGVKKINALPMTRLAYTQLRGWALPSDEDGNDLGFLVEYLDCGAPNVKGYDGYVSWSPKEVFDNAYKPVTHMLFYMALLCCLQGQKISRKSWNGKNMWVIYNPGHVVENLAPNSFYEQFGFTAPIEIKGHFDMRSADGSMIVGWSPSQTDLATDDWFIVS